VSLLLDLKVPPHIVREIVGHSDIEVTMTIYAHASLDEKRAALRKLGDALDRGPCVVLRMGRNEDHGSHGVITRWRYDGCQ